MKPSLFLPLLGAGLLALPFSAAADDASTNAPPVNPAPISAVALKHVRPPRPPRVPMYRDTTQYPPLTLSWSTDSDLSQVISVFAHPVLPQLALVTTQTGVLGTTDAGHTWAPLPGATSDKIGTINDIAFDPVDPATYYFASATSGIWMTTDGGKTSTQIGSKSAGMAADAVVSVGIYPGDPSYQTLLAVHGDAAPGLSYSRDGGKTWTISNDDYHFHKVMGGEGDMPDIYLIGSSVKEPDITSLYTTASVGDLITELVRDVVPTDMNFSPTPFDTNGTLYLATSDSGLYRLDKAERAGLSYNIKQLGSKDDTWSSVNVTWGSSADAINLYLYDSTKLGLVISGDDLATTQTASDGLQTGGLIKEGAVVRPNANGTVFYGSANGALQIARAPDDVPQVEIKPATFETDARARDEWKVLGADFMLFAKAKGSALAAAQALVQKDGDPAALGRAHQITITARVPAGTPPPKSVTVDLTRYGGSPEMPLFDDGQHDDGAAGDGVYGNTFGFLPELHLPRGGDLETRSVWPGRVAVGVRTTYADGHVQGAVGVMAIYSKTVDLTFWTRNPKSIFAKGEGTATATGTSNPPEIHNATTALKVDTKPGAWTLRITAPRDKKDIASYGAISFWIRASDGTAAPDLSLQLCDAPEFAAQTTTPPVPILEDKTLGADYVHVVIPLSKLIPQGSAFQSSNLGQIILTGHAAAPATYFIDGLQILVRYDDADASAAPPSGQ